MYYAYVTKFSFVFHKMFVPIKYTIICTKKGSILNIGNKALKIVTDYYYNSKKTQTLYLNLYETLKKSLDIILSLKKTIAIQIMTKGIYFFLEAIKKALRRRLKNRKAYWSFSFDKGNSKKRRHKESDLCNIFLLSFYLSLLLYTIV